MREKERDEKRDRLVFKHEAALNSVHVGIRNVFHGGSGRERGGGFERRGMAAARDRKGGRKTRSVTGKSRH